MSIRLSENAFRNLKAGNKRMMNNPNWHSEMRNFCEMETTRFNKVIKDKSQQKEARK